MDDDDASTTSSLNNVACTTFNCFGVKKSAFQWAHKQALLTEALQEAVRERSTRSIFFRMMLQSMDPSVMASNVVPYLIDSPHTLHLLIVTSIMGQEEEQGQKGRGAKCSSAANLFTDIFGAWFSEYNAHQIVRNRLTGCCLENEVVKFDLLTVLSDMHYYTKGVRSSAVNDLRNANTGRMVQTLVDSYKFGCCVTFSQHWASPGCPGHKMRSLPSVIAAACIRSVLLLQAVPIHELHIDSIDLTTSSGCSIAADLLLVLAHTIKSVNQGSRSLTVNEVWLLREDSPCHKTAAAEASSGLGDSQIAAVFHPLRLARNADRPPKRSFQEGDSGVGGSAERMRFILTQATHNCERVRFGRIHWHDRLHTARVNKTTMVGALSLDSYMVRMPNTVGGATADNEHLHTDTVLAEAGESSGSENVTDTTTTTSYTTPLGEYMGVFVLINNVNSQDNFTSELQAVLSSSPSAHSHSGSFSLEIMDTMPMFRISELIKACCTPAQDSVSCIKEWVFNDNSFPYGSLDMHSVVTSIFSMKSLQTLCMDSPNPYYDFTRNFLIYVNIFATMDSDEQRLRMPNLKHVHLTFGQGVCMAPTLMLDGGNDEVLAFIPQTLRRNVAIMFTPKITPALETLTIVCREAPGMTSEINALYFLKDFARVRRRSAAAGGLALSQIRMIKVVSSKYLAATIRDQQQGELYQELEQISQTLMLVERQATVS